jgi:hypothetical protein
MLPITVQNPHGKGLKAYPAAFSIAASRTPTHVTAEEPAPKGIAGFRRIGMEGTEIPTLGLSQDILKILRVKFLSITHIVRDRIAQPSAIG